MAPQIFGHALRINPLLVIIALLLRRRDLRDHRRADGAAGRRGDARDDPLPAPPRRARAVAPAGAAADLMAASVTLEARSLTKHFGERVALRDVSFELAARRDPRGDRPQRRRQDDAAVAARRRRGAERRAASSAPAGDGSAGCRSRPRSTRSSRCVENLRLFARLERVADPEAAVALMLEQTGLRERAGEQLGRLSGGNRQRVNIAIGLLAEPAVRAARRALGVARPAPARAAVAVHRRPRPGRHEHRLRDPRHRRGASATPRACSCWPTASCCFSGPPVELRGDGRRARARRTSRRALVAFLRRSLRPRECGAGDASAGCCEGPADPAPLAGAERAARSSTPSSIAVLIGLALSRGPGAAAGRVPQPDPRQARR